MVHILPGSFEIRGDGVVIVGVHVGGSEWDIRDLRYLELRKEDWQEGDVLITALDRLYDNSTGCMVKNNFGRNT